MSSPARRKDRTRVLILSCLLAAAGLACSFAREPQDETHLVYWTAPSVEVSAFDRLIVEEWSDSHPDQPIKWRSIPAGVTSEEVILTAIATGTGPDVSTNIFAGFAAQLADADAIVALDTLPGFWELVGRRRMTQTIRQNWMYKGHVYVIPIYTSPQLLWYNERILAELGVTALPRTYGDFIELARRAYIPGERYALWVDLPPVWWKRWFDYITFYCAATGGKAYVDAKKKEALFDVPAGVAVAEFFHRLFSEGLIPKSEVRDGFEKGMFLAAVRDAAQVTRVERLYPDLRYTIAPLLVPDSYPEDQPIFTLAEQKGMVIFNGSKKKARAWEFMQWFFTEEHDRLWMEITNYLPARDDLLTNGSFQNHFASRPTLRAYAEATRYTASLVLSAQTVQLQTILNRELWQPIVFGTKSPTQAASDADRTIEKLLRSGV